MPIRASAVKAAAKAAKALPKGKPAPVAKARPTGKQAAAAAKAGARRATPVAAKPIKGAKAANKSAAPAAVVERGAVLGEVVVRSSASSERAPAVAEPAGATPAAGTAATDVHAITGEPLLPRDRSADPLRRSGRGRESTSTGQQSHDPAGARAHHPGQARSHQGHERPHEQGQPRPQHPGQQQRPPHQQGQPRPQHPGQARPHQPGQQRSHHPQGQQRPPHQQGQPRPHQPRPQEAAPVPVNDPTWGALPAAPRSSGGDREFSDFWGVPDAGSAPTPAVAAPPAPRSHHPGPAQAGASSPAQRPPQGQPHGQPQGDFEGGEGGRRRRRRRRRRGREFETGPDGQQRQVDPLHRRLRRQFNLQQFRPGQEQVIRDLLAGKDVLAIMPTGAGKSLTYQLTAFELPGVTVVVSPLLALMSDQLLKLRRTGAVAARLDSTEGVRAKRETLERIDEGRHKIIYCTPERAASGALIKELGGQKVALFVVDEAHCVSEWGHDFRPAYLAMKTVKESLPSAYEGRRPPVLALTATATPQVAEDIQKQLDLKEPDVVHTGFNRPSLAFEVRFATDLRQQVRRLLRLIRRIKGPGIVYCSTVRDVEALHGALPKLGLRVGMYHGRMTSNEREESQRAFMRNNPRIMIATNAFGLGVDKPDIRFVIHYNMPGSIEAYYQEAGRAGRDGKPSRCVLLYNPNDEAVQEFFVGGKYPGKSEFKSVAFALSNGATGLKEIAIAGETSQQKARVVLGVLKDHGFAVEEEGAWRELAEVDDLTLGRAAEEYRKRREADRGKLEAMIRYARSSRCRVQILLDYFGEKSAPLCHRCDNCKKYGAAAAEERMIDINAPIDADADDRDDEREPLPEIPQAPPPPRKDPTHHF
jgi:ATP-dependent DNA helicase RecQ